MPAGAEFYDMNGNTILGVSDATGKYIGEVSLPAGGASGATGTITDSRLSSGSLWWVTTLGPTNEYTYDVNVSLSGSTLTWRANANCPACKLYFGVI